MNAPLASVVVPCRNAEPHLAACLASVLAGEFADFELLVVDDASTDASRATAEKFARADARVHVIALPARRGVSAARNVGLDAAKGRYVFFVDADDAVSPRFLAAPIAALELTGADYCRFPHRERLGDDGEFRVVPPAGDYTYASRDEIIADFLPRLFGYSHEQVRAWYCGRPLWTGREFGGVCWCAFRRDVIVRGGVRFDETIALFEDAMFNCEYLLHCERTVALDEPLYDYVIRPHGAMTALGASNAVFAGKLRLLEKRKQLDALSGGRLTDQYAASCVFSLLEMMRLLLRRGIDRRAGLAAIRAYRADPVVRRALRTFPLSPRRPLVAAAVLVLRFG